MSANPTQPSRIRLNTSAYDRVSSLLISLLAMTSILVGAMVLIYWGSGFIKSTVAIPVKPVWLPQGGGGGGNGIPGSGDESPEVASSDEEKMLTEPQISKTLDVIASAV